MACHEIAALRLGLMRVLGIDDEAERQHELSELGDGASKPGPIRSLCDVSDLASLRRFFEASLSDLEQKVATTPAADPKLPYLRALVILTKKTELELRNHAENLTRFYRELDVMHDFVHEIYPAE
jgi:Protein of unknown function (DUF3209)